MSALKPLTVDGLPVRVDGHLLRIARLADEHYVPLDEPAAFIESLHRAAPDVDLFTFVQGLHETEPKYNHPMEHEAMAVLPISTYRHWLDKQIRCKPRNMLRKAMRSGVQTRPVPFDDALLRDILRVLNESPLRQGKRNRHYGKDIETVRREQGTFPERSEFIGAYLQDELVGFAKLTHGPQFTIMMSFIAMMEHRDKAVSNALIARVIEQVAAREIPLLNYGVWGRRGLNEFKVSNAFECRLVPRYYVPLTQRGRQGLALGLHRSLKDRLPEPWIVAAADLRARWNEWRYAVPGPAARRRAPRAG